MKMLIKVFILLTLTIVFVEPAKLLRKPKVYNAIITTDENLTPSQAFPIIQPVIQPAIPLLSPFYPTSLYESYNRNDVNDGRREFKHEKPAERKSEEPEAVQEPTNINQARTEESSKPSAAPENQPENVKSPIPLNEYGFPPSLIPLQKYPTYPYSYPFIYDSYGNIQAIQQYPVLPPNYYPQQEHQLPALEQPMFQVGARKIDQEPSRDEKSLPTNENSISPVSSDAIKNNGNRNTEIPDVEIPPFPFSTKKN